jgi:hypothetical protein
MKKLIVAIAFVLGVFAVGSLVKYGADTYKENHKSRGAKLIDTVNPKHRK